eukprot:COSAG03_NODE_3448_length_2004_cov_17.315739_1_plen_20_part_10
MSVPVSGFARTILASPPTEK